MTKRAATTEAVEVERKVKKEEPKEETPSAKDKLAELTKEELIEKYLSLSSDYEAVRAKVKRAEGEAHLARIRYTLKDREHRTIAQDRCNARWKLLGDSTGLLNQKRGIQMEAFVHDTLITQREEIHGLKKDLDSAKTELNTLRGKASEEHSKEWERTKKLKEENDKLRADAKKKAEMEKQLSLSQKANAIYKAKFKEQEKELAERNSRIRQLEEAPRADEEEGEMEEDGEEKEGDTSAAKEGDAAAAAEEEEPEELMLDDGHEENSTDDKTDE
ncbi:hypothetical protein PENTCL1PPCAC_21840 [Pristionchus entomophagus]|uniref:Uncharacterized protein n=1 Tax=Pristionchus entomophagus TaxID=358040 RepID=A0AAV5TYQ8_9BILA|nr:hypothetical protein PENTCL1PPCAC_21840 [Pristionchus entomophagus]